MGKVRNLNSGFRNLVRPIVLLPGGGRRLLEYYKGSTTGNTSAGTSKIYYRETLDPPTPVGELTPLGSQKWEVGVNVELWNPNDYYWWQTPLITGIQADISSGSTSSIIMTLSLLKPDESVIGVCNTTTLSTINSTTCDIADPVWSDSPTWAILGMATMSSGGSFSGNPSALLMEISWSGEVHTTGPTVGPPTMNHWGGNPSPNWSIYGFT